MLMEYARVMANHEFTCDTFGVGFDSENIVINM